MSKEIVKNIADSLGDDFIARRCGVSEHSVRSARWRGQFPASWFTVVKAACDAEGLPCPVEAFNFKSPSADAPASAVGE